MRRAFPKTKNWSWERRFAPGRLTCVMVFAACNRALNALAGTAKYTRGMIYTSWQKDVSGFRTDNRAILRALTLNGTYFGKED